MNRMTIEAMKLLKHRFSAYLPGTLAVVMVLCVGLLSPATSPGAQPGRSKAAPALKITQGKATYYGARLHGRKTASGQKFNKNALVAAHPKWPFGTVVRVTNLSNSRTVTVKIIDRGPAKRAQRRGVIIDLSRKAAQTLGFIEQGKADVRLGVLAWGKGSR